MHLKRHKRHSARGGAAFASVLIITLVVIAAAAVPRSASAGTTWHWEGWLGAEVAPMNCLWDHPGTKCWGYNYWDHLDALMGPPIREQYCSAGWPDPCGNPTMGCGFENYERVRERYVSYPANPTYCYVTPASTFMPTYSKARVRWVPWGRLFYVRANAVTT
jgi:hypothetical protein